MNYEQILQACKDEVARKNKYDNWQHFLEKSESYRHFYALQKAAILAMQRVEELQRQNLVIEGTMITKKDYWERRCELAEMIIEDDNTETRENLQKFISHYSPYLTNKN